MSIADVCISAVFSSTPHSFNSFIVSAIEGTVLCIGGTVLCIGGADEASTLVVIFSTPSILLQVCLYNRKNGLVFLSSFSSLQEEEALRFFFFLFCNVDNLTSKGLFSISCTSSSLELLDKSPGVYAVAPLTWAPPNIMCSESKLAGPHFLNCTCLHFLPLSGSLNPVH
jgi:hypothetical protein